MADENLRLRAALRDLVALSTIPAGWIGIEPRTIASGLADILAGSLGFDFAFVRLLDPTGGVTIDVTSGCATREFLDWLHAQLFTLDESLRKPIIPNVVDLDDRLITLRGIVIPIGFNAYAGLVAVGCEHSDFPTETDRMLLTVAANHAATAFLSTNLVHERRRAEEEVRKARDELEMKVMERTAELQRTMAELTHMNRVATAGILSASITHEISQPLAGIVLSASAARRLLALREPSIEEARDALDQIENDGHRACEIIASLRGMFKKETQARNLIDVNELIFTVLAIVRYVAVEDTGTGIDPSDHDHIFNPMFTTKERGMGIGLSICHSIVTSHSGRIWVTRGIDKGSIFEFELPTNVGQGDQVHQHQA